MANIMIADLGSAGSEMLFDELLSQETAAVIGGWGLKSFIKFIAAPALSGVRAIGDIFCSADEPDEELETRRYPPLEVCMSLSPDEVCL